jgi:hypothetical protein
MKKPFVWDIETMINLFTCTFTDMNGKSEQFVLHEEYNNGRDFIKFIKSEPSVLIGYNSIGFDYPVIHYLLGNIKKFKNVKEVIDGIYARAQAIIESQNSDDWKDKYKYQIKDKDFIIPQMDLMRIWHYDNKAKLTSLKQLEVAMQFPIVDDMPFKHFEKVTKDDIEKVLAYNKNDCNATLEFLKYTLGNVENKLYKNVDKYQLRKDITAEFGFDALNMNDVKIGDEINKLNYLKATGLNEYDLKGMKTVRPEIFVKDCIPSFIKFESEKLNIFLENLKKQVLTGTKGEFSESIIYKGVGFTFGQGGIHSTDGARKFYSTKTHILEDRDCASMYPTSIINWKLYPAHLGLEWLEGYIWTRDKRIEAKSTYKKSKDPKFQAIQEAYKLALNGGGFGKTGEPNSWQFDPLVSMTTTIGNQLCLLMLCEKYLDNGIEIISANTDGVLIIKELAKSELISEIDKWWEAITQHTLEYTPYTTFVQTSVNDYLAVKPDGEIKYKGDFDPFKELHKDHSFRIVPLALSEYFSKGISFEQTIRNHTNIYDFCGFFKTSKGWTAKLKYVSYDNTGNPYVKVDVLPKTNRYFISTDGGSLMKQHEDPKKKGGLQFVEKGAKVTMLNRFIERKFADYKIDYKFYILEAEKIRRQIETGQLELI